MKIGLLKEIKAFEHRVMLTPAAVEDLIACGNQVYVESGAGNDSSFTDKEYEGAGAQIIPTSEKVFEKVELVLKIQPPMPIEYDLFNDTHISFSLLFPQNKPERIQALIKSHAIFLTAELIGPVKDAMSEIAGKVAINQAVKYLERDFGSKGLLFSGACGLPGASVCILGCGASAISAANQALLFGAKVNLIDKDYQKLVSFKANNPGRSLEIYEYNRGILDNILMETDVLIATGKNPGQKSDIIIKKEDIQLLQPGSLVIDLSINYGDCIETSRQTTHDDPIYIQDGILYYSVSNLPSAVPRTSSEALSNIAVQYIRQLSLMGFDEAVATNPEIRKSLLIYRGKIVSPVLAADSDNLEHYDILELIESNI